MCWYLKSTYLVLVAAVGLWAPAGVAQSNPVTLSSPNQRLNIQFATVVEKDSSSLAGKLVYSVTFRGKQLLDQSALALELEGQPPLGGKVQIVESVPGKGSDDYTLLAGKVSGVHDQYNSLLLRTAENDEPHRSLEIE